MGTRQKGVDKESQISSVGESAASQERPRERETWERAVKRESLLE